MAESRSVVVRLMANVNDFKAQLAASERAVKGLGDQADKSQQQASTALGKLARSAQDNRQAWDTAGTALAGFGAVTTAALAGTVKAAIDWESAWTGVQKTVDGSAQEMAALEGELRGLARTLPATHGEIAAVAEAAGQLGVKREDVASFTKTMIDLGSSTSLSADEAATSIAQMANVMGTAPEDVDRLGASLVALGNAGASTETEILRMASYLTGAAALIGASESDVLAMSNSLVGMGINAERGGGVMTRVMQDVYSAVQIGGSQLEGFADVAGMSAEEFARAFEADPIRAIGAFTDGLGSAKDSGDNVIAMLNDLGYKGTQDTAVLLQMASAQGMLNDDLDLGAQAWAENTALVEEAAQRYDTTASKLAMARNGITDAAIEIGNVFLPVLADMAEGLADAAGWFADLPDPIQKAIGGFAGVAGVAGLAGGAFLLLFPRVIETYKAFQTLKTDMPGVADGLGKVGKAAGIAGVLFAAASAMDALMQSMGPAAPTMEETTAALLNMGDSMASIDAQFQGLSRAGYEIEGFADAADRLINPGFMDRVSDFAASPLFWTETYDEGSAGRTRLIDQMEQMGESLALMVQSGNMEGAAERFDTLAGKWEQAGGKVSELRDLMPAYGEALLAVENQQALTADSAQGLASATAAIPAAVGSTFDSLANYAVALGLDEDATEELRAKTEELGTTLADFVNPLGVYTGYLDQKKAAEEEAARKAAETAGAGVDAWQDFVVSTGFSFDEYMRRLEEQVSAQTSWQENMLVLAGRVSQGTLDELARMGPEGAPLVAELVARSDAELDRFDDITAMRSKEATDAWGAQLTMAAPVLAEIGRTAGSGVVAELAAQLAAGTTTVAQIARDYGVELAGGINPILASLGKGVISLGGGRFRGPGGAVFEADGGVVDYYANGGVTENHVAQIASAGDWRVWAEPETPGLTFIPPARHLRRLELIA
jgi:TP901 family phage tail tape measure protein